mmetsp:Transcript_5850/g.14957  ORF Transcript_5850/g.14957 Transcript_5850/m.14957 type:complete len:205 (+) Transcript_5850:2440-3054(+)
MTSAIAVRLSSWVFVSTTALLSDARSCCTCFFSLSFPVLPTRPSCMSVKACTSFLLWYFTMFPVPPSCSMETAKLLLDCRLTSTLESAMRRSRADSRGDFCGESRPLRAMRLRMGAICGLLVGCGRASTPFPEVMSSSGTDTSGPPACQSSVWLASSQDMLLLIVGGTSVVEATASKAAVAAVAVSSCPKPRTGGPVSDSVRQL